MIKKRSKKNLTLPQAKKMLPINYANLRLKPRELRFVAAYCSNGFNGKLAMSQAGYSRKTLSPSILKHVRVQEALRRCVLEMMKKYQSKMEYLVTKYIYKRAFFDISTYYDANGDAKSLDDMTEEERMVVDGCTNKFYGKDADVKVKEYQLANRDTALKMLFQFIQILNGVGVEHNTNLPSEMRQKVKDIFNRNYSPNLLKEMENLDMLKKEE